MPNIFCWIFFYWFILKKFSWNYRLTTIARTACISHHTYQHRSHSSQNISQIHLKQIHQPTEAKLWPDSAFFDHFRYGLTSYTRQILDLPPTIFFSRSDQDQSGSDTKEENIHSYILYGGGGFGHCVSSVLFIFNTDGRALDLVAPGYPETSGETAMRIDHHRHLGLSEAFDPAMILFGNLSDPVGLGVFG